MHIGFGKITAAVIISTAHIARVKAVTVAPIVAQAIIFFSFFGIA
jgi:hypothetical protein